MSPALDRKTKNERINLIMAVLIMVFKVVIVLIHIVSLALVTYGVFGCEYRKNIEGHQSTRKLHRSSGDFDCKQIESWEGRSYGKAAVGLIVVSSILSIVSLAIQLALGLEKYFSDCVDKICHEPICPSCDAGQIVLYIILASVAAGILVFLNADHFMETTKCGLDPYCKEVTGIVWLEVAGVLAILCAAFAFVVLVSFCCAYYQYCSDCSDDPKVWQGQVTIYKASRKNKPQGAKKQHHQSKHNNKNNRVGATDKNQAKKHGEIPASTPLVYDTNANVANVEILAQEEVILRNSKKDTSLHTPQDVCVEDESLNWITSILNEFWDNIKE